MQPTTTHTDPQTDPIAEQTPEPAPAAATATPAPAEPAEAFGFVDLNVTAPEEEGPSLPLPTAEEMAAAVDAWEEEQDDTGPSPLAAACAAGTVKLFRLRASGTTRRLPWLAGEALETAEWYRLRVDQGATVRQVAEQCATSKATVRRALSTLALMDEITDGLHDDLYAEDVTEIVFGAEDGEDA
ncbi:hypothetical protein DLJ47_01875 [Micromonospora sp. S4605]|uniref:hypothetical protein n=1 Tax=Micromonospora sp. S4605 TaxID=1420897 RepID=UPI000D6F48CD|nr:hypothetical protein [Micromonospora sp. S4605]PWU57681.1 hypothetical protein DLJ47_01875 [Micromonospora sp. S4605]